MSKTYIADKDTLDAVNGKIGTKDDAPSPNPISLFAGIKQLLKGLSDHMATWTSDRAAKVDYLDTTVGSRAPANTALSTAQWTNARAGYLDKLNNGSYGLEALKGYVDEVENLLKNTTYGLNALKSEITAIKNATNKGFIKSVQRGLCSKSGQNKITINTINPNKAFVLLDGQSVGHEANDFSGMAYLEALTETTLTIYRPTYTSAGTSSWQVVEFY